MLLDDYVCRLVREFVIESAFFDWPPNIRCMIVNRDIYIYIYTFIFIFIYLLIYSFIHK